MINKIYTFKKIVFKYYSLVGVKLNQKVVEIVTVSE